MEDFVRFLVNQLVEASSNIDISREILEGNEKITILAPEESIGKIIGKGGRIAKSMRLLANAQNEKINGKVLIFIEAK